MVRCICCGSKKRKADRNTPDTVCPELQTKVIHHRTSKYKQHFTPERWCHTYLRENLRKIQVWPEAAGNRILVFRISGIAVMSYSFFLWGLLGDIIVML